MKHSELMGHMAEYASLEAPTRADNEKLCKAMEAYISAERSGIEFREIAAKDAAKAAGIQRGREAAEWARHLNEGRLPNRKTTDKLNGHRIALR